MSTESQSSGVRFVGLVADLAALKDFMRRRKLQFM